MVDELVNPYIAGAPVTEARMFFGREDVFDWIQNSLVGRYANHILVIHGQRRVGKTSVLKQLGNRLPKHYIPVFFDLQGRTHTTLDRFLWWLAREIVRVLKQERGIEIPLPEKEVFSADLEYFENHFLPGLHTSLDGSTLLLTFDEFDNLEESEIKEILGRPLIDYLRRMLGNKDLNFIFSIGSSGRKLENMQASYTDFFKTALYKKISFLGEEQTYKLVTQPVEGILEFDKSAVNCIFRIAGGHPYFTQLTCHELFARCQRTDQRQIREADVEAILDDVVERGTVNLKFVWDEASDIEKWALASLASLDKSDNQTLAAYLHKQNLRFSESDLTSGLLHLREKDILTQENRFVIHLLRLWLQKNRPIEQVREELTEVNPIANRYIEIGLEFKNSRQYEKAIESFQEALAVSVGNVQAQVNIALVYMDQKAYDKAVGEFEKALVIDDEDVTARSGLCEAHLALGDTAMQKGRWKEAAQSYQRVLDINEEHTEARQHMAEFNRQRAEKALTDGRDEEALTAFAEAMKYAPEDKTLAARVEAVRVEKKAKVIAAQVARSEKEAASKNWEAAVHTLEEAGRLAPDHPNIQKRLEEIRGKLRESKLVSLRTKAQGAIKTENFGEALKAWQEYLSFGPNDREKAEDEISRLKKLVELEEAYNKAQQAITDKRYDNAISLLKEVIVQDENFKDTSRLLVQAIELRRTAPNWWRRKAPQTAKRTPLPRSRPRVSPKKIGLIGAVSLLVLGLVGGLLWVAKNGLPAIFDRAADKTPTASPPPTVTPDLRTSNPANQHQYLYVSTARTWHEARNYCALKGGYLATIQTAAENEFVYQLTGGRGGGWLGATDEAEEGGWIWITGEPWTYKNWSEGEPSNSSGVGDENYMVFNGPELRLSWNDIPAEVNQPFVCEWGRAGSDLDPDIHAKLDTIQNMAPIRQINFDAWEFGDPPENATLENGKLVLLSENQEHVGVSFDILHSDNFAVEFEFRVLRPDSGGCFFGTDNDNDGETGKWFGIGFELNSKTHLEYYVHPDQHSVFAEGSYDDMEPNKVTLMVHGGTITVFINGIYTFDVPNPDVNTFYSRHSFSAEGNNACEFDNYRLWDLSGMDFSSASILTSIADKMPDYEDDFSNLASGWPTDLNSTGNEYGYQDGAYLISTANECNSVNLPTGEVFSDFVLEMDIRFITQEQGMVSIFFRINDTAHYGTNISAQGGTVLHKNVSDTHIPLFETVVPEASFQAWNDSKHLTLIARQDQMAFYVNGQMVIALADPSSSQGQLGFGVCTGDDQSNFLQVLIDNLKIWDLSGVDFSDSTETTMPTPTNSALQKPAWVTDFAKPVLDNIEGHTPNVQANFDLSIPNWLKETNEKKCLAVVNGEMIIDAPRNDACSVHWTMWYTDFVIEMDARMIPLEDANNPHDRWHFFFRGDQNFAFYYDGMVDPGGSFGFQPELEAYHVLIIVQEQDKALFINNQPIYYGNIPSGWKNGEASWFIGDPVAFDNIKIWDLNNLKNSP